MNLRAKELAVYKAVLELLDEGTDINLVTVSQVAERAGIGKGTVYEYFASKEEMVVCAILYEMQSLTKAVMDGILAQQGFLQKIYWIFEQIEKSRSDSRCFARFLRHTTLSYDMGEALRRKMELRRDRLQEPCRVLENLVKMAVEEGLAGSDISCSAAAMALGTKFMMFLLYLENPVCSAEMKKEDMKSFLYQGLLSDLRQLSAGRSESKNFLFS